MATYTTVGTGVTKVWSDTTAWVGGVVPPLVTDDVNIAVTDNITADSSITIANADVYGTLYVDNPLWITGNVSHTLDIFAGGIVDVNSTLTVGSSGTNQDLIWVYGTLRIDGARISQNSEIYAYGGMQVFGGTLQVGTTSTPIPSTYTAGVKYEPSSNADIYCTLGFTVEFHGADRQTVTKLAADVAADGTVLTMEDSNPTGWVAGDELWSGSWYNASVCEAESFDIASVSGTTLNITGGAGAGGGVYRMKKDAVTNKYGQFLVNVEKNVYITNVPSFENALLNKYSYFKFLEVSGGTQTIFFDNVAMQGMGSSSTTLAGLYFDYDSNLDMTLTVTLTDIVFVAPKDVNSASWAMGFDLLDQYNRTKGSFTLGEIAFAGYYNGIYVADGEWENNTWDVTNCKLWFLGRHRDRNSNGSTAIQIIGGVAGVTFPYINTFGFNYGLLYSCTPGKDTVIDELITVTSEPQGISASSVTSSSIPAFGDQVGAEVVWGVGDWYHYSLYASSAAHGMVVAAGGSCSVENAYIYGAYYGINCSYEFRSLKFGTLSVGGLNISGVVNSMNEGINYDSTSNGLVIPGDAYITTYTEPNTTEYPVPSFSFKGTPKRGKFYIENYDGHASQLAFLHGGYPYSAEEMVRYKDDAVFVIENFGASTGANYAMSTQSIKTSMGYGSKTLHTATDWGIIMDPANTQTQRPSFFTIEVPVVVGSNLLDVYLSYETTGWDGNIQITAGAKGNLSTWVGLVKRLADAELTISEYDGADTGWSKNTLDLGNRTIATTERILVAVSEGATVGPVYVCINGVVDSYGLPAAVVASGGGGGSAVFAPLGQMIITSNN